MSMFVVCVEWPVGQRKPIAYLKPQTTSREKSKDARVQPPFIATYQLEAFNGYMACRKATEMFRNDTRHLRRGAGEATGWVKLPEVAVS